MIKFRNWRNVFVSAWLSWFMKFLMLAMVPYEFYRGGYLFTILILVAVGVSMVPSIVEKNYNITLPFELDLLITLSLFLHTFLGEGLEFYNKYWIWDKLLHVYGAAVTAIIAFVIVYSLHYTRKLRLTLPFIVLITFTFAVTMGAMWEIGEFSVDRFFGKQTQKGLADTMYDLINDMIGGFIVAVLGAVYVKYSRPETRHRLAKPIGEVLGIGDRVDYMKRRLKRIKKKTP
ncbi:MAG: hypothetical protein BMS9Abin23_0420 [Thermodesulfobacteriota bacterium]|nr:MAG: hypothetical protein BMS9Abin23_0420 [Thermodesulfobacteriota bacterium]